jgi:hypothetical protein
MQIATAHGVIWACVLAGFYSVGHNRPFARCTVYYVLRSVLSRLAAGEHFVERTLKNHISLSFLSARAYVRTSQNINCWDLVLNPTHEILWSRSEFFSLRGRVLRAGPPPPLAFSVFCFRLPPTTPDPLGPCTDRER